MSKYNYWSKVLEEASEEYISEPIGEIDITIDDTISVVPQEVENKLAQLYNDNPVPKLDNWNVIKLMTFNGPKLAIDNTSSKYDIIASGFTYDMAVQKVEEYSRSLNIPCFDINNDVIAGKISNYVIPSTSFNNTGYGM
jgi:hypothetical protein